tara:strand:- start:6389 stop:6895 length:507 start_codon:yes stop_codon:yes gene_type:complete
MGAKLEDMDFDLESISPFLYRTSVPPNPHSLFEEYILKITPYHGVSWVKAIGKTIHTSAYGSELRSAFDSLLERLAGTYGKYNLFDFLLEDSIWNEPRDWMQSLLSNERRLCAFWNIESGANLSSSLAVVFLGIMPLDSDTGCLIIEYAFENDEMAIKEIQAMEDEAL